MRNVIRGRHSGNNIEPRSSIAGSAVGLFFRGDLQVELAEDVVHIV